MKIVTPERDSVVNVPEASLLEYLAEHNLATVESGIAHTLVAFPAATKDLVEKALAGNLPMIRFRGVKQFAANVREALGEADHLTRFVSSIRLSCLDSSLNIRLGAAKR